MFDLYPERFLGKLFQNNEKTINAIESVGIRYDFKLVDSDRITLGKELKNVADSIIHQSIILNRDAECVDKAQTRVEQYQVPAQRGKSESKDCVIIEHFLKLASGLKVNGFAKEMVFVSSNSNDYGSAPDGKMPLDKEFISHDIRYCNSFEWALNEAGITQTCTR